MVRVLLKGWLFHPSQREDLHHRVIGSLRRSFGWQLRVPTPWTDIIIRCQVIDAMEYEGFDCIHTGSLVKTNFKFGDLFSDSILQHARTSGGRKGIAIPRQRNDSQRVSTGGLRLSCTQFLHYTSHKIEARREIPYCPTVERSPRAHVTIVTICSYSNVLRVPLLLRAPRDVSSPRSKTLMLPG